MSELLANTLPVVALKEGLDWEEDCYEQGELCPSEEEKAKTSTNKLTQKPDKLPVHMESMRHEIEFRQSNRSADFIQGIEEEESDDRFIHRGRMKSCNRNTRNMQNRFRRMLPYWHRP